MGLIPWPGVGIRLGTCSFCDALPDRTGIGQTAPGLTFPQPNLPPLQQLQPGRAGVFHRGRSKVAPYEGYHRWGGATQAKARYAFLALRAAYRRRRDRRYRRER
jgi:hypothetical protein